jgi:hypothetical protein
LKALLLFRSAWWLSNLLLAAAMVATIWTGMREFSVRQYLQGLLLERRSFLYLFISVTAPIVSLLLRLSLGWLADHRLRVQRFHLRANLNRATDAFFSIPEIK